VVAAPSGVGVGAVVGRGGRWGEGRTVAERLGEGGCGWPPVGSITGESPHDVGGERGGYVGPELGEGSGILFESRHGRGQVAVAIPRRGAGTALVEHGGEREDVGSTIEIAATDLFGGQVLRGAEDHAGCGAVAGVGRGDTEVGQLRFAVDREEDVGRLHVAMDQTLGVERSEPVAEQGADGRDLGETDGALVEALTQIGSVDPLEHDAGLVDDRVVDRDEVRVVDGGGRAGLFDEAGPEFGVGGEVLVEDLHGHAAAEELVLGLPDRCRRAGGSPGDDAIAPVQEEAGVDHSHLAEASGFRRIRFRGDHRRWSCSRTVRPVSGRRCPSPGDRRGCR